MIYIFARPTKDNEFYNLYVRVEWQHICTKVSLGVKVPVKDWSKDFQSLSPKKIKDDKPQPNLKGMSYRQLSVALSNIKSILQAMEIDGSLTLELIKQVIARSLYPEIEGVVHHDKPTFNEFVDLYIKQCESCERTKAGTAVPIAKATIKGYKTIQKLFLEYQKVHFLVIDWDDLTIDFLNKYKSWLMKKYSVNYIAHIVKDLKKFIKAGHEMHYTTCLDFQLDSFTSHWEEVDNVYLTHKMLDDLYNADLNDELRMLAIIDGIKDDVLRENALCEFRSKSTESLQIAADIFMIGCFSGQRVSDYKRISREMIEVLSDGREYIHLVQQKTRKDIYIPADPRLGVILDKYSGNLPAMADQKLNKKLKVIGLLMGWTHDSGIERKGKGLRVAKNKKFYECICTHTARRTFATLAYLDRVSLPAIMAITGHSSETSLRKYLKLDNKERALMAAEEFFKLRSAN